MCKENRCIIQLIISIILGIIIGVLFYTGTILLAGIIITPLIVATVFSIITLILLFIASAFSVKKDIEECISKYGICLIIGGVGTFIISFLGLTFLSSLVAGSVIAAILIGLDGLFFIFNLLIFIELIFCFVKNLYKKNCCKFENNYNQM